jgi:hypothetical protein
VEAADLNKPVRGPERTQGARGRHPPTDGGAQRTKRAPKGAVSPSGSGSAKRADPLAAGVDMEAKELKSKVEDEIKQLAETVDGERKGARFAEILDTMSRFHKYSFNNCILISLQKPDAQRVAGFNTWKSLGRFVKKGEKGIRILAPMVHKMTIESDEVEDQKVPVLRGFRTVAVFDISQTEGEELERFQYQKLGQVANELLEKTKQIALKHGYTLDFVETLNGPLGYCINSTKEIKIVVNTPEQMFSVLLHELGHALLEHQGGQEKFKELEAESVAYVVSKHLGLEPANVDYLLSYGATKEDIISIFNSIQKVSQVIISELQEADA